MNDHANGIGKFELSSGLTYQGQLLNGNPHGLGMYKYPDGKQYIGQIDTCKWQGFGVLKVNEESSWCGYFEQNHKTGPGINWYENHTSVLKFSDDHIDKEIKIDE